MSTRTGAVGGLIAASAIVAGLGGCATTPAEPDPGRVVTVAVAEPDGALLPAHGEDPGAAMILPALFSGLVAYGPDGSIVNDSAAAIETEDNIAFTITVADHARFSDGAPVTSSSFVEAWRHAAIASNEQPSLRAFRGFRGFDATEDADLVATGALEILDDKRFIVRLDGPDPEFPNRLGIPAFYPLHDRALSDPDAHADAPIGNGPYRLVDDRAWKPGDRVDLTVNERYRGPRDPKNAGLSFRFYDDGSAGYADLVAGELDLITRIPSDDRETAAELLDGRVLTAPLPVLESLAFPPGLGGFTGEQGELRREAIALAVQRERVTDELTGGRLIPAVSFVPVAVDAEPLPSARALRTNWQIADRLWDEADGMGEPLGEMTLTFDRSTGDVAVAEAIMASLEKALGIDVVRVDYPDTAALRTALDDGTLEGPYLVTTSVTTPTLRPFLEPGGGLVPRQFGDAGYADELAAADAAPDIDTAVSQLREAQVILLDSLPAIPLWSPTVAAGHGAGVTEVALAWRGIPVYTEIVPLSR